MERIAPQARAPQDAADAIGPRPILPAPANDPGDRRYPAHSEQQAYFLKMMEETATAACKAAEARLKRLERNFQRRQMRSIRGGRGP
jgi:hypothetical protein